MDDETMSFYASLLFLLLEALLSFSLRLSLLDEPPAYLPRMDLQDLIF